MATFPFESSFLLEFTGVHVEQLISLEICEVLLASGAPEARPVGGVPLRRLHLLLHQVQLVLDDVHEDLDDKQAIKSIHSKQESFTERKTVRHQTA